MRLLIVVALVPSLALAQKMEVDTLTPAAPETKAPDPTMTLPAIPSFELPPPEPGFEDPRRLRVQGSKLLDTRIKVKGYIVWIYDCITDVRKPKESKKQTQKRIDQDPTLCERPKFYLASTRDTPLEKALWIVDVPRPPNKLEKERLPKAELAAWPAVPKFKLGDYVIITGEFKTSSPHAERNSDGLIVFEAIEQAKPPARVSAKPTTAAPVSVSSSRKTVPAPMRKIVDRKTIDASLALLNSGNKQAGLKQYATAVELYRQAIGKWDGNHLAWYGLGGTLAMQGAWSEAREAFEHASRLRPDASMYQMWTGISSYEAAVAQARSDQAAKQNVKPEDIKPDLSAINFERARRLLEESIALEPGLWRAHYYLGRIEREAGHAKPAAESFTRAILAGVRQQGPYIALGELYRKWDYTPEAIAVAQLGTTQVPAGPEASDVHYVLGMSYDDQLDYKHSIEAFTRALELKPENAKALFQRGQAYFKLKMRKQAKADLEAFLAAAPRTLEFAKQQAQKMLLDLEQHR